jgi:hypothetical protein
VSLGGRTRSVNRREFLGLVAVAPYAVRHGLALHPARALVTCDLESRLAVVDLARFKEVGSIATLPDPRAVELVGDRAVVCHTAVGAVSIVDGKRVLHVLRGFGEPRYVAAHPDGVHAFVTDSGRSGLVAVDVRRGRVLGRVRLPGWARHVTLDRAGRTAAVALGSASAHVALVDVRQLRRTALRTPGFPAHDVGWAPDGSLWVTSGSERTLTTGRGRESADAAPQHVTFAASSAFVTSGDSETFRVLDLDGTVRRTTAIPRGSYNVQYGGGLVLTPSLALGTLTVLDRSGTKLAVVHVSSSCHDACFAPV